MNDNVFCDKYLKEIIIPSLDGIIVLDEHGKFEFANQSFLKITEWPKEEIIGQFFHKIIPESEKEFVIELLNGSKTENEKNYEIKIITRSGLIKYLNLSSSLVEIKGQNKIIAIVHDISKYKSYEIDLKESEAKYRELFDNANDCIYTIDLEGNFLSVNNKFVKTIKCDSIEEVLASNISKWMTQESLEKARQFIQEVISEKEYYNKSVEIEAIRKDGKHIWLEHKARPIKDKYNNNIGLHGICRDITELKRSQEEQNKYREMLIKAQELGHMGSWEWDMVTNELTWSKEVYSIYGLDPEKNQPNYHLVIDTLAPECRNDLLKAIDDSLKRRKPFDGEYSIILTDGSRRYTHTKGDVVFDKNKPVRMYGMVQDITQRKLLEKAEITKRKHSEEELYKSEERYRTMIDHSNDMIWTLDTEGFYQFVNKRVEEFSGLKLDFFLGKSFTQFIDPKELPKIIDYFHKVLKGEPQQYEVSVKKIDGSDVFLLVNTAPIYSNEKVVGTVSFGRDITERKKAEEMRLENERLLLANKIKSEFIAIINHELRTPLTSIIGFSELLKEQTQTGKLNEDQELFVEKVLANSNYLLELINDLLDLSKIEAGRTELFIEVFSVPAAINEVEELLKELAARCNITIRNELEPLEIEADKRRFKQIILNLLNNALKFSKRGGGVVTIAAKKAGDMAQISVMDTGIGIKKEDFERLFWAFEQVDSGNSRKYGGTGLGLTISKHLVELHGGTIKVESNYGEGSTFTFLLPIKHPGK